MDTKQLIDSFIKGDISEEQFETERAKLSPEAQQQLLKDAEAAKPDAVETLKSIRRGVTKIEGAQPEKKEEQIPEIVKQQQQENLEEAFDVAFAELGIEKEEDKIAFKESFKTKGTKAINVKNIVKDIKSHYAESNADTLLELKKQQREREIAAEEETSRAAGSNGSGAGAPGGGGERTSKEVKAYMDQSAKAGRVITKEQAERALSIAANKGRLPQP